MGRANQNEGRVSAVLALVLLAIVLPIGAFWLGQSIKSPEQRAAEARPPTTTPITAEVTRTLLAETISVRAEATHGTTQDLAWPEFGSGRTAVISAVPFDRESPIEAGSVIVVVSDRPMIALPGDVPSYRDITPGVEGPDVARLQQALNALGYPIEVNGVYGPDSQQAVEALYRDRGYSPPATASGTVLPASEVVFLPELPARLLSLGGKVGTTAAESGRSLATITTSPPSLIAEVDPNSIDQLREGMPALLTSDDGQHTFEGEVAGVPDRSNATTSPGDETFTVRFSTTTDVPDAAVGKSFLATITVASSPDPQLAVPIAAVYSAADGSTFVQKFDGNDTIQVEVETGMSAGGWIAIVGPDGLAEGDEVVVGSEGPPAGDDVGG